MPITNASKSFQYIQQFWWRTRPGTARSGWCGNSWGWPGSYFLWKNNKHSKYNQQEKCWASSPCILPSFHSNILMFCHFRTYSNPPRYPYLVRHAAAWCIFVTIFGNIFFTLYGFSSFKTGCCFLFVFSPLFSSFSWKKILSSFIIFFLLPL